MGCCLSRRDGKKKGARADTEPSQIEPQATPVDQNLDSTV
jgi:hypothetical protein